MDQWTPRVTARADLAELLLQPDHLPRAKTAGLLPDELTAISTHGRNCESADRLQKEQLAENQVDRGNRKDQTKDIFAREDQLRDRLPAVIGALTDSTDPTERDLGAWLGHLSFARYRLKEITTKADNPDAPNTNTTEDAEIKAVRRVERADHPTRLTGLAAFCTAIRRTGREKIIPLLAARGLTGAAIDDLGAEATALAAKGTNPLRAAEATAQEAEAANAQHLVWKRVRRMIRKAVQGVPDLEHKFADC